VDQARRGIIVLFDFFRLVARSKTGLFGLILFCVFVAVAILAPVLAPYDPAQQHYDGSGKLMKLRPPSSDHLLGTTILGRDVFSQLLWGTRPALIIGLATAAGVIFIGVNIGLTGIGCDAAIVTGISDSIEVVIGLIG